MDEQEFMQKRGRMTTQGREKVQGAREWGII
jgi:hypothetical protein